MAVRFTEEQQQVILHKGKNLLVSAAAGSGKTAVLVERIIRMITNEEHPVDIDRLLIVTFTSAAASEMRERISLAISKCLEETPENEHLQKQATLIHNAQIMTIDSFCLFLIRNNFNAIDLDPAFRVADEGEVKLLEEDVMEKLLEEEFAAKRESFLRCVETYSTNGKEKNLEARIRDLYGYALSYPWPEEWLENCKKDYQISTVEELENSRFAILGKEYIAGMIEECAKQTELGLKICEQPDGPYMYGAALEQDKELLEELQKASTLQEYSRYLEKMSFKTLSSKKDDTVNADKREWVKNIRNKVKATLQEIQTKYFAVSLEEAVAHCGQSREVVGELLNLAITFKRGMDSKKREKGIMDFSDMEHLALSILWEKETTENGEVSYKRTKTAEDLQEYYEEIMTDEYQDSNLVQEFILNGIAKENNRFMVGDVKQSIYKFRQARPELFMEKYHLFSNETELNTRIDLHKNFRSRQEVIDAVNFVFSRAMISQVGGVTYDKDAHLYHGASYLEASGNNAELLLIQKSEEFEDRELEARVIAKKIHQLVGSFEVTDKESGCLRKAEYRDIVILLRSGSGFDEAFREVLEEEGIPAYITSRTGYFLTTEIRTVLQVLRSWDNPLQDIPLFGTMKSFFGGFTDEELALIRGVTEPAERRKASLFDSISKYLEKEDADASLKQKLNAFLTWMQEWRQKSVYLPIHELLQELFDETHYMQYVTALPAGEKRRANVALLMEKAKAFEKTSFYGLFHFVRYIEKMEKYQVDYGEAETLDENANLVRIMTIHKSKGLEFPICFVAGLAKRFNLRDTTQNLITDMDLGVGTDVVNLELRTSAKSMRKAMMALKMKVESLGEELRVLYVAMTRAKEKLILSSVVENEEKWEKRQKELEQMSALSTGTVSFLQLIKATCFLDILLPIVYEPGSVIEKGMITDDILYSEELKETSARQERKEELEKAVEEGEWKLPEGFSYEYPHKELSGLYTKTTVSELKKASMQEEMDFSFRLIEEEEIVPYVPGFMKEKEEVSGTTRGTAFHRVMELLDFKELLDKDCETDTRLMELLVKQSEKLTAEGMLSKEYRDAVNFKKIVVFLKTKLAKRMMLADERKQLYKEQPFVLGVPASRLSEEFPEDETVLVQGIIDVCFEEDGNLILADYKTDVVNHADELIKRYHTQLEYYAEALERVMGKPVTEKLIYSFYLGEVIEL